MLVSPRVVAVRSAAVGALCAVTLTGCSRPPVKAEPAAQGESAACRAAAGAWPQTLAERDPYPVTTPSDSVRAWGTRPENSVIARCGVTSPGPTTDSCFSADGVDWVQSPLDDGNRFVTYGREPAIEVLIPTQAGLDGTALASFAAAAEKIPQGSHRCS